MGRLVLLGGRGTKVNLTKLGRPRRLAVAVSLGFVAILILVWIVASRPDLLSSLERSRLGISSVLVRNRASQTSQSLLGSRERPRFHEASCS